MESNFLHFAEHTLQEIALVIMAIVYTSRLIWLFHFQAAKERQGRTGRLDTTPMKGAFYSIMNIAMPWAMESTRKNFLFYVQFVIFHLGVVAAISTSFIIPYIPSLLNIKFIVVSFQIIIAAAFLVAVYRMFRRIFKPVMRAISTPDDYFSLGLLTVWFFFAFFSVPNKPQEGEGVLLTFFILTAFFLIYVPFSKISHYLYYPFTRYWIGKSLGYRGVYPLQRGSMRSQ